VSPRSIGRVRTRAAFTQLQRARARASCGPVRASFVPAGSGVSGIYPQFGYAIGKHCGNAVVRNRLRRRMRESARAVAATLPRGTYLLRIEPVAARTERAELAAQVQWALKRAGHSSRS
jgi:ribonuclease P protein component